MKSLVRNLKKRLLGSQKSNSPLYLPYVNWEEILENDKDFWEEEKEKAKSGPKILIASSVGSHQPVIVLDGLLGVALTLKGFQVEYLLCDGKLNACEVDMVEVTISDVEAFSQSGNPHILCEGCFTKGNKTLSPLGLNILKYSDYLSEEISMGIQLQAAAVDLDALSDFKIDEICIGEQVSASMMRFLAKGSIDEGEDMDRILRQYIESAIKSKVVIEKCFQNVNYQSVSFHHGIYVPQGIIGEVARKNKVPVVNWSVGYRKQSFVFSHNHHYHKTKLTEPVSHWENMEWNEEREKIITDYLHSRAHGGNDWIKFNQNPMEKKSEIENELGIDFSKPCIALLSNVLWDAQIIYPSKAFPKLVDWVFETINYFKGRPDIQLIIRVHPGEVVGTMISRDRLANIIRDKFPVLPKNVFIIEPKSKISTYIIADLCNACLIYGTKTGVELAAAGHHIMVAGEAWLRNKGISVDVEDPASYIKELDKLPYPEKLSPEKKLRALKFAYHYFFRTIIKVTSIYKDENLQYKIGSLNLRELKAGSDPGLNAICEGISNGNEFIYDEI